MGLGQNDNQLVTAVIHGFLNRNRIRYTAIYLKAVFDTSPFAEMGRKRLKIRAFMLFSTLLRKYFFGIADAVDYSTMAV